MTNFDLIFEPKLQYGGQNLKSPVLAKFKVSLDWSQRDKHNDVKFIAIGPTVRKVLKKNIKFEKWRLTPVNFNL